MKKKQTFEKLHMYVSLLMFNEKLACCPICVMGFEYKNKNGRQLYIR